MKILEVNSLDFEISIADCMKELRPHPKFDNCTFEGYNPDSKYPSQAELKSILQDILIPLQKPKHKLFKPFIKDDYKPSVNNLYIDGTYGIGKTHLLAATFNNFMGNKAFLSFLELTYYMNFLGLNETIEYFQNYDLLLIDEFDLDDPATTRMITKFIGVIKENCIIIATSNRLPVELGGSKFDVTQFAKELGIIADSFKTIVVEGDSYRANLAKWQQNFSEMPFYEIYENYEPSKAKTLIDMKELQKTLVRHHPFKFFIIPKNITAIFIENLEPIENLNEALRFVTLIDYCYYYNAKLFFKTDIKYNEIFTKDILDTAFNRQFLRCISRLEELSTSCR